MGVSPAALSAGRKAMPSAAGAAAIAAGASLRQMTQAAPAGVERDRGERDAKDKAAVGGSGVADKVAAVQQLQQQQAMAGR